MRFQQGGATEETGRGKSQSPRAKGIGRPLTLHMGLQRVKAEASRFHLTSSMTLLGLGERSRRHERKAPPYHHCCGEYPDTGNTHIFTGELSLHSQSSACSQMHNPGDM